MDLKTALGEHKTLITEHLRDCINDQTIPDPTRTSLGRRLQEFCTNGKLIRGSLIILAHNAYRGVDLDVAIDVACAYELIQSSLLILDDMMDQDLIRRGSPTIEAQYRELCPDGADPVLYGQSIAMCAAHTLVFAAIKKMQSVARHPNGDRILRLLGHDMAQLGLAQMRDVEFGASKKTPNPLEVRKLHADKTATYTFSLPLQLGALLADANDEQLQLLETYGLHTGIVFQVRDDHLGLYSSTHEIGKPAYSDITENKATAHKAFLYAKAGPTERDELNHIYGHELDTKKIARLQQLMDLHKIPDHIAHVIDSDTFQAREVIPKLQISSDYQNVLRDLLDYVHNRTK